MTREQFLNELDKELGFLSFSERRDVLNDYVAHFSAGALDGKSEAQICEDLGSIREIAASYRGENKNNVSFKETVVEPIAETKTEPSNGFDKIRAEAIKSNIKLDVQEEVKPQEKPREIIYAEPSKAAAEILAKSKKKSIAGYNVGIIISTIVLFGLIAIGLAVTTSLFFVSVSQTVMSLGFFSNKGFAMGSLLFSLGVDFLVGYAIYGLIVGIVKLAKRLAIAFKRNVEYIKGV